MELGILTGNLLCDQKSFWKLSRPRRGSVQNLRPLPKADGTIQNGFFVNHETP